MSDSCQEQRPLLDDDYDEEFHIENYSCQRRSRPSFCSGRARYHAKGAAAVIARWPDNCSTSVTHWWLGLIMIAITVFVIYNFVLILGMISGPYEKPPEYKFLNNLIKPQTEPTHTDVFMHLVVNNNTDMHVSKHLPHIDDLSIRYPNYKYTLLVLVNDTLNDVQDFNEDKRNKIAFDSLWIYKGLNKRRYKVHNISVEHVSLTAYLNESPIKKFWRNLPSHILDFLVRSVSIWEHGGISFHPIILTTETPNPKYIEKLYDILDKYEKPPSILKTKLTTEVQIVNKKRPNNIQDIINALSEEENNVLENDLNVADNNEHYRRLPTQKDYAISGNDQPTYDNVIEKKANHTLDPLYDSKTNNMTIPLFLKHFFHDNSDKDFTVNVSNLNNSNEIPHAELPTDVITSHSKSNEIKRNSSRKYFNVLNSESNKFTSPDLSIDIKGNIIASKSACHAFLGTMYSNAYRHTKEENLTNFITSELSFFCNGLLNSCEGINVILV